MQIGILGSGLIFSYAGTRQKVERLARDAGRNARAGTPANATLDADVLLLAVHWTRVDDVLTQAGDVSGKVIITCSLPMNATNTALVVAHSSSGAEHSRRRCGARKRSRHADGTTRV